MSVNDATAAPAILVLYSKLDLLGSEEKWTRYFAELSPAQQDKIRAFVKWEDRLRALVAKLLLRRALRAYGFDEALSWELLFTEYQRPYLDIGLDFNLSHSGEYVLCAASNNCRVGVDVELCQEVDFQYFLNVMNPQQWREIKQAANPQRAFFRLWTIKESVIKAEGRGLYRPLDEIEVEGDLVRDRDVNWYLSPLSFEPDYPAYLASDRAHPSVEIRKVSLG